MVNKPEPRFSRQIALMTLARLIGNSSLRMVYPFAPALARGLGVPIDAIYQLIFWRGFAGFLSPFFSPLSERYGRVRVMAAAMLLLGIGCALVVIWPSYLMFGITLSVIALAKVIFDPAMQAYIGENVPYNQRGKALSIPELGWSGAMFLGAPGISLLIARQGWSAPLLWLAILAVLSAIFLWRWLPRRPPSQQSQTLTLRQTAVVLRKHRVVWAALGYIVLTMAASETLLIVFGDWMESAFGLSLVALGFSAGIIGLAEASGEMTTGWAVDRFGKRQIIILTGLLNAVATFLLPFTAGSLFLAQIGYFALFFLFEMALVGSMPLLTEIVPSARAAVMSAVMAASALGRVIGAWVGPQLFLEWGFVSNGLVAALLMATAVLVLALWVREAPSDPDLATL